MGHSVHTCQGNSLRHCPLLHTSDPAKEALYTSREFPKLTLSLLILLLSIGCLPTDSKIQYKLASLCYNCLDLTTPGYLTELLKVYKPTQDLCSSSDTLILRLSSVHAQLLGQRSFSYAAPSVWNSLPSKVRSSNIFTSFKSTLKSHLFKLSYW